MQQQPQQTQTTNLISVNTTNSLLARAFGIIIRQITDLLIRWPVVLSASSLYHDILTTSATVEEQNALESIQVSLRSSQMFHLIFFAFQSTRTRLSNVCIQLGNGLQQLWIPLNLNYVSV